MALPFLNLLTPPLHSTTPMTSGAPGVVRAELKGVFPTYKMLKDRSRRTYWYHRATGKPLRGKPGSPEFIADYAAAEKLLLDRHAGTVNSLIRSYTSSVEFEEKHARVRVQNTSAC